MYILKCLDDSYYTGSTTNLRKRIEEHQTGIGATHTKKYGPVVLVYFEEFDRISLAFKREKQIQGWARRKKEALIQSNILDLKKFSMYVNSTHHSNVEIDKESTGN